MILIDNYTKISKYRQFFETYIREFIEEKLTEEFKEAWWEKGIPDDIKGRCKELKNKDPRLKEKPYEPTILMEKMDFSFYYRIITQNWKRIFEKLYRGQRYTWVKAWLKELNLIITTKFEVLKMIRDAEAHTVRVVPISDDEVETFRLNVRHLLCDETHRNEFEKLVRSLEIPIPLPKSIEEKINESGFDLLSDDVFGRDRDKRSTFSNGGEPNWMDIIANNAVKRSLFVDVMKIVEENKQNAPFLLPVVGAAGEGKTTLLRQIGYSLYQQGEKVLLYKLSRGKINIRILVEAYEFINEAQHSRKTFFILIDDIFEIDDIKFLLRDIKSYDLPIIVIGTSRINRFRVWKTKIEERKIVNCIPEEGLVLEVTREDVKAIRGRIFREKMAPKSLSAKQRKRLITLSKERKPLMVLMLELRKGKGFEEIINDEIAELREYGLEYYDVYRYVIATQSLGSWLPISLLETLLRPRTDNVYRVINNSALQGLIFRTEIEAVSSKKALRARHELIAKASLKPMFHLENGFDELIADYTNMINAINADNRDERGEVSYWLRHLLRGKEDEDVGYSFPIPYVGRRQIVQLILERCSERVKEIEEKADILDLINGWARICSALNMHEKMERILGLALGKRTTNPQEINEIFRLIEERWRAYGPYSLERKIIRSPDNPWLNSIYLKSLIESHKSCKDNLMRDEIKKGISEFIASVPDIIKKNEIILMMYALFLLEEGSIDAGFKTFDEILRVNPQNVPARWQYMKALRINNKKDEALRIAEEGKFFNSLIFATYINFLNKQKDYEKELAEIEEYLSKVGEKGLSESICNRHIWLLRHLKTKSLDDAIREVQAYVKKYPEDTGLSEQYIYLLDAKRDVGGKLSEARRILSYIPRYLFDTGEMELKQLKDNLDKGTIPENLRNAFITNKCQLSVGATVTKGYGGWSINNGVTFVVREVKAELNILNPKYIKLLQIYCDALIKQEDAPYTGSGDAINKLLEYVKLLRGGDIKAKKTAREILSRLVDGNPNNSSILEAFISILEDEGEKDDSDSLQEELIKLYGKLVSIRPMDIISRNKYAYLLYHSRNRNRQYCGEVIKQYEILVENGQREHNYLGNLYKERGVELRKGGYSKEATEYLEKAGHNLKLGVEELQRKDKAYNDLGLLYLEKEEIANAIHSFLEALKYNAQNIWANYSLGKIYEDIGDPEARRYYQATIELRPDNMPSEQIQRAYDYLNRLR
jgi:tetratricopeptide (TPR) repeat protein